MKKQFFTHVKTILSMTMILLLSGWTQTQAQQLMLRASDDAVVWSEFVTRTATEPDILNGGNILANRYEVTEGETTVTHNVIALVKFDISHFANRTIKLAEFSTRGTAKADTETTLRLRKAGAGFQRDTTNWENKPSRSGELALKIYNTLSDRRAYDPVGTDLVDYINEELAKGSTEIAFSIEYKAGDLDAINWIGGKGDGAWGPELLLEFDDQLAFFGLDDAAAFKEDPDKTAADHHASNIIVTKIDDNTEAVSFVKFHLPGFAYKRVSSAEFSTRGNTKTDKEQTVQLRKTTPAFSRDTTNWSNKPNMSGEIATRVYNNTIGSTRTVYTEIGSQVVDYINQELAKGNETIAFGLQYDSGDLDAGNWNGGVGDGVYGPMLVVVPDFTQFASQPVADAVAYEDSEAVPAPTNLFVSGEDGNKMISYIQFDISGFSGRVASTAGLTIRGGNLPDGATMEMKLTRSGNDFSRDAITWENKPATSGELATADFAGGIQEFTPNGDELIKYINSKLKEGASVISFAIEWKSGHLKSNWIGGLGDGEGYRPILSMEFDYDGNLFGIADAVADQANPDVVWTAKPTNIRVDGTVDAQLQSFVKFDISAFAGVEIVGAEFSTRGSTVGVDDRITVKLVESGTGFARDTTTWNNKPATGAELASKEYDKPSDRREYINVDAKLVDYVNKHTLVGETEIAFGLAYKSGDADKLDWIGGIADGSYGPELKLTVKSPMGIDTLLVMADAYVSEVTPDDNFGDAADMGIRKSDDGTDMEVLVKFDISDVADAVIGKVSLTAYIGQHDSGTAQDDFFVDIYAVEDNSWEEMAVNWTDKPAAGLKLIEENVTWFGSGQDVVWTSDAITHYINTAIAADSTHVSFVIKGKDNTNGNRLWMAGREWKPLATKLILDYLTPPPAQQMPVVADSYVSQAAGETDQNYGDAADQHLVNDDENDASKWIYFKYDLSGAYDESVSASLVAYGSIHNESPNLEELNFNIYSSNDVAWEEEVIAWDTKPAVNSQVLLTGTLLQGGRWMTLTSAAFTDFINAAIDDGREFVTLVAKAVEPTPGQRGWLSGKEWRASYITLNYEPEVALPKFSPNPGSFISSVDVTITTPTAGASIYYTLDNTDPTEETGTLYTGPITLEAVSDNETFNVRAIAFADELNPSGVVTGTYHVTPVGLPQFTPTPAVPYQQSVLVTIDVEPAGSVIRYSDDGTAPTTLYSDPILLTETTTLRAQAYNADFSFSTEIVEVTYEVVETEPAPGIGPAGIGFTDLSRENQPAIGLWLRAHDLDIADGEKVTQWADISGNENHAHNDESLIDEAIENTGEKWKAAPVMVADGINGWPTVHFGTEIGGDNPDVKNLVVDDADELDGGAGISIFLVVKRNQMHGDFAAIFQKRDVRNQPAQSSYVLEMDGGANPNKMQFVIARDIFLKSIDEFNTDDYYIVNTAMNSEHKLSSFLTNGELKSSALYQKAIQNTHAPVIIGGFQPVDIAEVVLFNSDVNNAQTVLVQNYLAAKYGLTLEGGVLYTDADHIHDIIGVGRVLDIAGVESDEHKFSAGGGLQLFTAGLAADGDFVIAGHNGADIADDNEGQAWSRFWNVETAGDGGNVSMRFDFDTEGVTNDPTTDYKLWYKDNADGAWTDMGITPVLNERVLAFDVVDIQNGIYAIGVAAPGGTNVPQDISAINDGFSLYPNPARAQINVDIENAFSGTVEIKLLDMYGRLITSDIVTKGGQKLVHLLDLEGLRSGTYMVEVKDSNRRSIKLFLVK